MRKALYRGLVIGAGDGDGHRARSKIPVLVLIGVGEGFLQGLTFGQRLHRSVAVVQHVPVSAICIERDCAVLACLTPSPSERVLGGCAIAQRGAAQGVAVDDGAAVFGDLVRKALYRGLVIGAGDGELHIC